MTPDVIQVQHPQLGTVKGCNGDVVSFRGLQYATLNDRLADPVLKTRYTNPLDATTYGPMSPNPPGAFQLEMTLIQRSRPDPDYLTSSETESLSLNIWVPRGRDGELLRNLPVFVWVHGGGFVSGSGNLPHYDLTRFVRLSTEQGTPVIGVTINYRLGLLGLLTSQELRDAGYKPNNQLRDQRVAFQWLRKYISGFGGNPGSITAAGESTGAVTIGLHLLSDESLFEQAYLTGGSPLLLPVSSPEDHETSYNTIIRSLGLESTTASERIQALISIPYDELMAKVSMGLVYRPMLDNDLIKFPLSHAYVQDSKSNIPGRKWLQSLMIGDSQFDSSSMAIFAAFKKPGISSKFSESLLSALGTGSAVEELLAAYGFDSDSRDDETAFRSFLDFSNDIGYFAATCSFATGFAPITHTFALNEKNPWNGMFQGEATHVFDVVLLFQNFQEDLPAALAQAGKDMASDAFLFIRGKNPWVTAANGTMVYGPSSSDSDAAKATRRVVAERLSPETGRRRAMIDHGSKIGLDKVAAAYNAFMSTP
ncbi:unnamed protein product [Clonostachys rosea]|uniref:Carboxylesterase type B domain-containing protein n=1 Tax=Bionectria ochroleuca TaxID=29856 RepID=A0ABY6V1Z9_BIOOC|nr:unnamed protein product [Clonostachys rosea]